MKIHHRPSFSLLFTVLLGTFLFVPGARAQTQEPELPDRIDTDVPFDPYFLSSEAALLLKPTDPYYSTVSPTLRHMQDMPASQECTALKWSSTGHQHQAGKGILLAELVDRAEHVVPAVVEGVKGGFRANKAGQLLKLRFEQPLKGTLDHPFAFLFVASGDMEFAGRCYRASSYGVPSPPAVGERLLLLLSKGSLNRELSTLHLPVTQFLVLPASGPVRASSFLQMDGIAPDSADGSPVDSRELLASLRLLLAKEEEQQ